MMNRKYEFTGEVKEYIGRKLHRIRLHRIRRISDGLIGGWIESEENLSQEGNCFVYDNAMVYGNAMVFDDAEVYDNARIFDNAKAYGNALVFDNAKAYGNALVLDNARIYGFAMVCGNAMVYGNSGVYGNSRVYGEAEISDESIIGKVTVKYKDIFQYQCKNRILTAILTENDEILYTVGCQDNITKEVFLDRIYNEGGGLEENPHRKEYLKLIPLIESYFGVK